MVLLSLLGSVESISCTAAHLRSCSLNIVPLSHMIEGSCRSSDLYTTGQLVDGLQQKKKTDFHWTEMESCRIFLGENFIVPPCIYIYIYIYKSDLTDKMKRSFFQAAVVSILLYGCTIWTPTKQTEKKLDGNYARILRAILNKCWRQHFTKQQVYGYQPPITKTIKVRRTRHAGQRLEKLGRAHEWCTPMEHLTWLSKSRATSVNLHSAALWGYGM